MGMHIIKTIKLILPCHLCYYREVLNLSKGHDSFSSAKSAEENVCVSQRPYACPVAPEDGTGAVKL